MAFIDKKDPVVLNIKLTSKGRELLSAGSLDFKYYVIGDSEMDYGYNAKLVAANSSYTAFNSSILRPVDKNPDIISFVPLVLSGDPYTELTTVPVSAFAVENQVEAIGFFDATVTTFLTDSNHMRQPDVMVDIDNVIGGQSLTLLKAPTYGTSGEEPQVGDLLYIRWTHDTSTTGYTVNNIHPTPNLVYRIESIVSGTIGASDGTTTGMVVNVDRKLPNLSGHTNIYAGVFVYYNQINYSGDSILNMSSTEYLDESVLSFLQNSQCSTVVFPFWNMSIIFTEEIAGVLANNLKYTEFVDKSMGGFVSYIQNQAPVYKKLGVIHYTNSSPANVYGEGFLLKTAVLDIPTIMWHKSSGITLGASFIQHGNSKLLTGNTKSLNITYYDLVDVNNTSVVVGKVFNDLKLFVIEDQELLFAMSYKSNRNWTLPDYDANTNTIIVT